MSALLSVPVLTRVLGQTGRRYVIQQMLRNSSDASKRIYLAKSGNQKYILKSVRPEAFRYCSDMFDDLRASPYVRVSDDAFPEHSMFSYRFLRENLLTFFHRDVPLPITQRILRDALRGIAALHDKDIVHLDMKADNIMLDWEEKNSEIVIEQVRVIDLEDASYVPDNCVARGEQFGNWIWRSPEAHVGGPVHKPTDMFSFGLVCIYAILKRTVLQVDEEKLPEGTELLDKVFELQVSYFGNYDACLGLMDHIRTDEFAEYLSHVMGDFTKDNPRTPIAYWQMLDHDPDFKDLMVQIMSIDPKRRLTAKEALAHPWFADVCG